MRGDMRKSFLPLHFAVALGWVTEGIIPSPAQVLRSWEIWIFGSRSFAMRVCALTPPLRFGRGR